MDKLIIIAGWGSYPRLLIEGAKRAGVRQMDVVAIKGSTDRATWKAADNVHWITLGGIADGIRWCGANGYQGALMAPTEVLAGQHYETLLKMKEQYHLPIHPVLLTGCCHHSS